MTDEQLEPLKDCPFCGCNVDILDENINGSVVFTVYCRECRCQTPPIGNYDKAIAAWNRRAT